MIALVPITDAIINSHHDWARSINSWDAKHYAYIIKHGYTFPTDVDPQANWAFFPLYPMICAFLRALTLNTLSVYVTGMIVSNICIFIAAYYTAKLLKGRAVALVGILLFASPYAFYSSATYTESLFIMTIALSFYAMSKKNYVLAGFFAMLTSATRIVGCLLVFPIIMEMFFDWKNKENVTMPQFRDTKAFLKKIWAFILYELKRPADIFSIMISPFGTFAYMFFLRLFCGDAWAFLHVQIAWRDDKYFPIIGVLFKACTGQMELRYTYMGWFCIAAFALYGYMIYKKRLSMAVFGIIALLVPLTSHVMSTPRFIMGAWVTYVGLYDLLESMPKWIKRLILAALIIIEAFMIFYWYNEFYWFM